MDAKRIERLAEIAMACGHPTGLEADLLDSTGWEPVVRVILAALEPGEDIGNDKYIGDRIADLVKSEGLGEIT